MKTNLRLGFHYHVPACLDENRSLRIPGYLGRFLDELAARCSSVVCFLHSPRPEEMAWMDYTIQASNVEWVDLGLHDTLPKRLLRSYSTAKKIHANASRIDVLLVRGPTPLLNTFARALGNLPLALLLVGDYVSGIDDLPQPPWRKELIRLWARWNKAQQTRIARRSLTFVNSRILYEELSPIVLQLVETRTTTLSEMDFFMRADTCGTSPFHLLYTGRLDRAKGLLDMVEALAILRAQGQDVHLNLAGWSDSHDRVLEEMQRMADRCSIGDRLHYLGFKPLGAELFDCYRQADIFIIASKASEGFPRSIWEAMASSLPVVATRVGSIPAFIDDAAELVRPNDPEDLAAGISRLLTDPPLRQDRIRRGLDLARGNTLESQVGLMVQRIDEWVWQNRE